MITNLSLGVSIIIFAALSLPFLFLAIFHRKENEASSYYIGYCISGIGWGLFQALFYLFPDESAALFLFDFRLVFVCYSCVFTYLLCLKYLQHFNITKSGTFILICIPIVTGILVAVDPQLHLVRQFIEIVPEDGVRTIQNENGIWFWVHTLVSYACLMMALMLIIRQYRRLPKNYRVPVALMLLTILLSGFFAVAAVFHLFPYSLDLSPYGVILGSIIFYYALFHSHDVNAIFSSRDAIYENASYPILILSNEGNVMDYNKKALALGKSVGLEAIHNVPYKRIIDAWLMGGQGRVFEEDDSIITVVEDGLEVHYQLAQHAIYDKNDSGKPIGSYAEVKNITPMMSLIHKLQDQAYFDQLTGLLNRRSFTKKCKELDRFEYLPLGIVVGDVNRLKQVNDTFGHVAGDLLLQAITNLLLDSSSEDSVWFRIGGDEFVALFPNTTHEQLAAMTSKVEAQFGALQDERFHDTGIAMAYRIKTDMEQEINALLEEADSAMYADKWDRRRNR